MRRILFCLLMLFPRVLVAQESEAARAWKLLEGLEPPQPIKVTSYDCEGKWRTSSYCRLIWAAHLRFFDKDDNLGALEYAAAALEKRPNSRQALAFIGRSLWRIDGVTDLQALPWLHAAAHVEESTGALRDYLKILPTLNLSDGLLARGVRLAELAGYTYERPYYWLAAAKLHREAGRPRAAANRAERMVASAPDDPDVLLDAHFVLKSVGDQGGARHYIDKAIALRASMREEDVERLEPAPVEALELVLAVQLVESGEYEDAKTLLKKLLQAPQEAVRIAARKQVILFEAFMTGPARGLELVERLDHEEPELEAQLRFQQKMVDDDVAALHPEDVKLLTTREKLKRLLLLDNHEGAEELIARYVETNGYGDSAEQMLAELDFARAECGTLGKTHSQYLQSKSDYSDLWRAAMGSAAWRIVCGKEPRMGFNTRRDATKSTADMAIALHDSAALFAQGKWLEAQRTASGLPREGGPQLHRFGMWVSAGAADETEFRRHQRLARRDGVSEDERLAELLLHLRRNELDRAREAWRALPFRDREIPIVASAHRALLRSHIVSAAHELDPTFARDMAERWFRTRGPIDRRVWEKLKSTPAEMAVR